MSSKYQPATLFTIKFSIYKISLHLKTILALQIFLNMLTVKKF